MTLPVRWWVKKSARAVTIAGSWASGSLLARRALGLSGPVRALIYHRFGERHRDPYCVPEASFRQQMEWVAREGRAVSLEQVEAQVRGEAALPPGSVLVTIDDGAVSTFSRAGPILADLQIPAVAFVPTALIENPEADEGEPERFMRWDEVAALPSAGIEVGSHSHGHRSMASLSRDEIEDDLSTSIDLLAARAGVAARSFAYPYGTRADFDERTRDALQRAGFAVAFNSQHGSIHAGADILHLRRVKVEGGEGLWRFRRICDGGMDAWALVDTALWRLQQDRRTDGVAP